MIVKQRLGVWCGIVIVALMLIGNGQPDARAGMLPPPPRATLTPLPPPHATLTPLPPPLPTAPGPGGAYIELRLPTDNINLWTVVQWQDGVGNWHDVESWRGMLDDINDHKGDKVWGVLPGEYGVGPMRWLVYERAGGKLLATSYSFYLPDANRHVIVEVVLK